MTHSPSSAQSVEIEKFLKDVATQTPEKPDYWSSCGQCERNSERAQDLLEASAAASAQATGQDTALSDAELAEIDRKAVEITDEWSERQANEPTKQQADAMFIRNVAKLLGIATPPSPDAREAGGGVTLTDEQRQSMEFAIALLEGRGYTGRAKDLRALLREAGGGK